MGKKNRKRLALKRQRKQEKRKQKRKNRRIVSRSPQRRMNELTEVMMAADIDPAQLRRAMGSMEGLLETTEVLTDLFATREELRSIRLNDQAVFWIASRFIERHREDIVQAGEDEVEEWQSAIEDVVLNELITPDLIHEAERALDRALAAPDNTPEENVALLCGKFFLLSTEEADLQPADNPLWDIVYGRTMEESLERDKVMDGLLEEIRSPKELKEKLHDQDFLEQVRRTLEEHPLILRYSERRVDKALEKAFEAVQSGEFTYQFSFDQVIHFPLEIGRLMERNRWRSKIPEDEVEQAKEEIVRAFEASLLKDMKEDVIATLRTALEEALERAQAEDDFEAIEWAEVAIASLETFEVQQNPFISKLYLESFFSAFSYPPEEEEQEIQAILQQPLDPCRYTNYAQLLMDRAMYDRAIRVARVEVEMDHHGFGGYWHLGNSYAGMGRYSVARKYLQVALHRALREKKETPDALDDEMIRDIEADLEKWEHMGEEGRPLSENQDHPPIFS